MAVLKRKLVRANGAPRAAVFVKFRRRDPDLGHYETQATEDTDHRGEFQINLRGLDAGTYVLEYYGDGISPTILDESERIISEDPVTPWEYNIIVTKEDTEENLFTNPVLDFNNVEHIYSTAPEKYLEPVGQVEPDPVDNTIIRRVEPEERLDKVVQVGQKVIVNGKVRLVSEVQEDLLRMDEPITDTGTLAWKNYTMRDIEKRVKPAAPREVIDRKFFA